MGDTPARYSLWSAGAWGNACAMATAPVSSMRFPQRLRLVTLAPDSTRAAATVAAPASRRNRLSAPQCGWPSRTRLATTTAGLGLFIGTGRVSVSDDGGGDDDDGGCGSHQLPPVAPSVWCDTGDPEEPGSPGAQRERRGAQTNPGPSHTLMDCPTPRIMRGEGIVALVLDGDALIPGDEPRPVVHVPHNAASIACSSAPAQWKRMITTQKKMF